jgi:hypothetical protein
MNTHAPSGIRTHNLSRRAAEDPIGTVQDIISLSGFILHFREQVFTENYFLVSELTKFRLLD